MVGRRVALGTGEEIQMAKDCWCAQQTVPFPINMFSNVTSMYISPTSNLFCGLGLGVSRLKGGRQSGSAEDYRDYACGNT